MKANSPPTSHLHRAVSKKQILVRTACATRLRPLLLWLLLTLPAVVQAQFNYTSQNGTITITRYTGPGGAVAIPDTINGLPVTSIGNSSFYGRYDVASVTIPNSVTSIGYSAFSYCVSLTSVTIPDSVTSIWNDPFAYCTSLGAITVDALNSVYSSVHGVLFNKSQTLLIKCPGGKAGNYTIPNSVTRIAGEAFAYCASLTSVTLGNSVTDIGYSAFGSCTSLTSVTIPNSVTNIAEWAFAGCASLTSVTLGNSVTRIGDSAFGSCTSLTSVAIPNSVTSIERETFAGCTSLTSVTIPNSVTRIGEGAFAWCTSLTSVTIPNSVTRIENSAFYSCTSLTGVYFQGNAPDIGSNLFVGANNATVYYPPGTTGWWTWFAGPPVVLWNPPVDTSDPSFGVRTNRFGFTITGASDLVIVVEASTDLANPAWVPVGTNILTGGSSYFSDPEWTNHPARFYRLRSP